MNTKNQPEEYDEFFAERMMQERRNDFVPGVNLMIIAALIVAALATVGAVILAVVL